MTEIWTKTISSTTVQQWKTGFTIKIILVLLIISIAPSEEKCPNYQAKDLWRLGKTRFYIIQAGITTKSWSTWETAKEKCKELGLKLAKIDDMETDVLVGRRLEEFMMKRAWHHTYYWMDAKFDRDQQIYVWQDTNQPIKFSNFFYFSPRPKGLGDYYTKGGEYQTPGHKDENCLSLSMPLDVQINNPNSSKNIYGHHTSWYEKRCLEDHKSNTLCESADPHCNEEKVLKNQPFSRSLEDFRPMSDRRFVVYWRSKNFKGAKNLCKANKMQLYSPDKKDLCLIKNLKNWMRYVTSYSFWTDVNYDVQSGNFEYPDGSKVPLILRNRSITFKSSVELDKKTCVSLTYNFEQEPFNPNFCNGCNYNSLVLSPENCANPIGVICQHPDYKKRDCHTKAYSTTKQWKAFQGKDWKKNPALTEFLGFNGGPPDSELLRSAFKQPGDVGACPTGYRRLKYGDPNYWDLRDFHMSNYPYDYLSPYWLNKQCSRGKCICRLSRLTYDPKSMKLNQKVTDQNCKEWLGFYLCTKIERGGVTGDSENDEGVEEVSVLPSDDFLDMEAK